MTKKAFVRSDVSTEYRSTDAAVNIAASLKGAGPSLNDEGRASGAPL